MTSPCRADVDLDAYVRSTLELGPNEYVTPLMIPAADISADSQTSPYFFSFGSGSYDYDSTSSCHMAPVFLPFSRTGVSVTLNNFYIFGIDNNGSVNTTYNLYRRDTLSTASPQLMGTVTTAGATTAVQVLGDTTIDNPVISNSYFYYITWCFSGPSLGIQGFWLYYTES